MSDANVVHYKDCSRYNRHDPDAQCDGTRCHPDPTHTADYVAEVLDSLPKKFWRVTGWDARENWAPVYVDAADRKRVVEGILDVLDGIAKEHTDDR